MLSRSLILALAIGFSPLATASHYYLNFAFGPTIVNLGSTQYVVFPADSFRTDSFKISSNPINYTLALGVSYDKAVPNMGIGLQDVLIGVNAYYSASNRSGTVLEYGLSAFANSKYQLNVESERLMLDTEWDFQPQWRQLVPFLQIGIGATNNSLKFTNNPLPVSGVAGGYYSLPTNSQIRFAYELGAGIKYTCTQKLIFALRYLYANLGTASSSTYDPGTGVALGRPISIHVSSQSLLLSLNYLIG